MRDVDFPPDEDFHDVLPDDPEEQTLYLQRFRGRYAKEIATLDPTELENSILAALQRCPSLKIRDPRDVLRFLRLEILVLPKLNASPFLKAVIHRVLNAINDWSATKRFDFIDKHIIGRPVPTQEPDFGPWWQFNPFRVSGV